MLSFLFVFYFLYIGLSISFNAYLYAFGLSNVPGMNLSKENSVYLNSVLYFSVVVGQFFAIFLSRKVSPTVILVIDLSGVVFSMTLMAFLPLYGHVLPHLYWIGVGGIGLCSASIYGTTFLWAERYITVNASAASIFIIGGALGEMVLTLPVGFLIEKYPLIHLYLNYAYVVIMVLVFFIMWKIASAKGERLQRVTVDDKNEKIRRND